MQMIQTVLLVAAVSTATTTFGSQPATSTQGAIRERFALLIGADEYAKLTPLEFAGRDTDGLYTRLRAMGFKHENIVILNTRRGYSTAPLKTNIEAELDSLLGTRSRAGKARKGDLVLVVFSGHGLHVDKQGSFLCPVDVDRNRTSTMIAVSLVFERMKRCPAAVKLLWIDACRNDGAPVVKAASRGKNDAAVKGKRNIVRRNPAVDRNLRRFANDIRKQRPKGVVMMTSCKPGQYSREDANLRHGVFLHFVLKGLDGDADGRTSAARGDQNGRVSLKELFEFARAATKAYVKRKHGADQEPELIYGDGDHKALEFEFGSYRTRYPYTIQLQVRVGGPNGRIAPDAVVTFYHQAKPLAELKAIEGSTVNMGSDGKGEVTVRLSRRQRDSGTFFANVQFQGETLRQDIRG